MRRDKTEESKLITVRESKEVRQAYYHYFEYSSDKEKRLANHRFARSMAYKTGKIQDSRIFGYIDDKKIYIDSVGNTFTSDR